MDDLKEIIEIQRKMIEVFKIKIENQIKVIDEQSKLLQKCNDYIKKIK